jgi:hypothetical protein
LTVTPPEPELTDGRLRGDFASRYPSSAWLQIVAEFFYLLLILGVSTFLLVRIGFDIAVIPSSESLTVVYIFEYPRHHDLLIWIATALAGMCGGVAFDMKWLYHSVAKGMWNRDRWLWRITVPVLSGVLSVFLAFAIVAGIVPFLNQRAFNNFYVALGFGFVIGYFSDNTIAALQRLARHTLGTLDNK